jgi:hypothetical protein
MINDRQETIENIGTQPLRFEGVPEPVAEDFHRKFSAVEIEISRTAEQVEASIPEIKRSLVTREEAGKNSAIAIILMEDLVEKRQQLRTVEQEVSDTFPLEAKEEVFKFFPEVESLKEQIATLGRQLYLAYPLLRFTGYEADYCTSLMLQCHDMKIQPSEKKDEVKPPAEVDLPDNLRSSGYYVIADYRLLPPIEWYDIQRKVYNDPNAQLTEDEFALLQKGQDSAYKLHVQVPRSQYRNVVAAIVEHIHKLGQNDIFWKWKFRPLEWIDIHQQDSEKRFPVFVFYSLEETPEGAKGDFQSQLAEISQALEEHHIHLPGDTPPPRFSTPVEIEGEQLPGFFLAQGDGDHKLWLKKRGLLDQYYDEETGYAVRRQE